LISLPNIRTLLHFQMIYLRSQQSAVGLRWSPACEDVSPEAEERPPSEPLPSNASEESSLVRQLVSEFGVVSGSAGSSLKSAVRECGP
jgi:hypothetical protein